MEAIKALDTGIKSVKNVKNFIFGFGSFSNLEGLLDRRRKFDGGSVVFFVDIFFEGHDLLGDAFSSRYNDLVIHVDTKDEPTTRYVNQQRDLIRSCVDGMPAAIVAIGGGATMDVAKAVANLLTNLGDAEDYQGWDLVKKPGVFKIGIPTVSGTGAEATRTCVMVNPSNGLKLGMNSDWTVFDQVIMDPAMTATVPRNQFFWTGMDAYIHSIESLRGRYRNPIGDAFSTQTVELCKTVFSSLDMMSDPMRSKLMVASYLGGCAIAMSYVGVVHPFSAALSVVLGIHHCVANCIVMRGVEEFYPREYDLFWSMVDDQKVEIPTKICEGLSENDFGRLFDATIVHEKPLVNALGVDYLKILSPDKVRTVFEKL